MERRVEDVGKERKGGEKFSQSGREDFMEKISLSEEMDLKRMWNKFKKAIVRSAKTVCGFVISTSTHNGG